MVARLSLGTLCGALTHAERRGRPVVGPGVDPAAVSVGIVHLGVGAFHRSHQAVHTEDAAAADGDTSWGILGVAPRSARVVEQLRPQDGLYSVLTAGRTATSLRVVGSLRDVALLKEESERVLAALSAPSTHVVTTTVSEKGYHRAVGGGPDITDPDLAADVDVLRREVGLGVRDDRPARTPVGTLCRALVRRRREHGAPVTVVCCDNLADNGGVLRDLVDGVLAAASAEDDRAWVADAVRFPSTMVDRITPTTAAHRRDEAAALLGLRDEGLVVAEPFSQWVIQDAFAGPRPRWERAGVVLTADVASWERAKLRLLNGTHSAAAYLGALAGHRFIDEAVTDPRIAAVVRGLQAEARRTLDAPEGLDLEAYGETVLERFGNPATGHTTAQVAGDGSQKLPHRIIGTIVDLLDRGEVPIAATRAMAAWAAFVARGRDVRGVALPLDDPLAPVLRAATAGDDRGLADRILGVDQVFPPRLQDDEAFRRAFREELADLLRTLR
jgi:fructuronate reductase